jgi:ATP-dependent Clp protease ATP-binding subunit ClpA
MLRRLPLRALARPRVANRPVRLICCPLSSTPGSFLSPKDFLDSAPLAAAAGGTSSATAVATNNAPVTVTPTATAVNAPAPYQAMRLGVQLSRYATDLTKQAVDGELEKVIGREDEIQQAIQILSRRRKNNPCLIGEPGVGKYCCAPSAG